jgi:hypothetical protein
MTFEDWWPTAFYHTTEEVARQAWEAATYAASSRAGDASNEAEKVERLDEAVVEAGVLFVGLTPISAALTDKLRAIIAKAQG